MLKQRFTLSLFTFLLTLSLSTFALAASFTGGKMTIDVPAGWSTAYDQETNNILVSSPKQDCVIGILVTDSEGMSDKEAAEALSKELKGETPEKVEGYENYSFAAKANGVDFQVSVMTTDSKVMAFMEGGNSEPYQKEINSIWNSLSSSDPKEKELFDTLADN